MEDKICLVTGATSGIGMATARGLAKLGAMVIVVGRNSEKGAATIARIQQETGNPAVEFMLADLSVQAQVRRLAGDVKERHPRLDVLINNVGGFFMKRRSSADGIEMTLALNYLNVFLLTNLLLDALEAGAPARVVNTSSAAHQGARIDFDDLGLERRYRGMRAYGQAKLAVVLFTYELARRLERTRVTANVLHPGFVATNIGQGGGALSKLFALLLKLIAVSPEEGAQTSIYLASSPNVAGVSGTYFKDKQAARSAPVSYDEDVARRLWEISAGMTGLR